MGCTRENLYRIISNPFQEEGFFEQGQVVTVTSRDPSGFTVRVGDEYWYFYDHELERIEDED